MTNARVMCTRSDDILPVIIFRSQSRTTFFVLDTYQQRINKIRVFVVCFDSIRRMKRSKQIEAMQMDLYLARTIDTVFTANWFRSNRC